MPQRAAVLLERFTNLGIVVAVEGGEVHHRFVEITVDLDSGERHELEPLILDQFEFAGDDATDEFTGFRSSRSGLSSAVVAIIASRHQLRSSSVRSISRSS